MSKPSEADVRKDKQGEPYEPCGVEFYDLASGRRMMLVDASEPQESLRGWLLYWHDGYKNWVTLRKATDADILQLARVNRENENRAAAQDATLSKVRDLLHRT